MMSEKKPDIVVVGGGLAGCEAAWQLAERGLRVRLFEMRPSVQTPAHTTGLLADPAGADVERVVSARQLRSAVLAAAAGADAVVMAAAVADFRPETRSDQKVKKAGGAPEPLRLVENPDVLRELAGTRRPGQVLVGFAAETEHVLEHGRAKLAAKGCDLLVVNQVGGGLAFGTSDNEAVVLAADGTQTPVPRGPKEALADVVWDLVAARLAVPG